MNPERAVIIHRIRVILHTSPALAAELQQAVSQAVRHVLSEKIASLIRHHLADSAAVNALSLTLTLGTLPFTGFAAQFAERVCAALDKALAELSWPEEDNDRQRVLRFAAAPAPPELAVSAPVVAPAVALSAPLAPLARFLTNGYWPAGAMTLTEPSGQAAPLTGSGSRETALADVALPVLAATLCHILFAPSARLRLVQACSAAVQARLLRSFTCQQSRVRAPDALRFSRVTLLLASWHYALHQPDAVLPGGEFAWQPEEVTQLGPAETQWLAALIRASTAPPLLLYHLRPWLAALIRYQGDLWQQHLSPAAAAVLDRVLHTDPPPSRSRPGGEVRAVLPEPAALPDITPVVHPPPRVRPGGDMGIALPEPVALPDITPAVCPLPRALPGQEQQTALPQTLRVHNAGLVLVWPLLPRLLHAAGLLEQSGEESALTFISSQAQQLALVMLDALIWCDDEAGEWRSLLNKLLCGWPLTRVVDPWPRLTADELACPEAFMALLPQQIPGLLRCQPDDIRTLFLQRPGTLTQTRSGWQLTPDPHASDILLRQLPWPVTQISYPWLPLPLPLVVAWDIRRFNLPFSV